MFEGTLKKIDLVRLRPVWYSLSGTVIVLGLLSLFNSGINWGLDFTQGALFQFQFPQGQQPGAGQETALIAEVRKLIVAKRPSLRDVPIQISGDGTLMIKTQALNENMRQADSTTLLEALRSKYPGIQEISHAVVGPVVGAELKRRGIIGVILGCLLIFAYVWIRYNIGGEGVRYATAAIASLIHDILVLLGGFSVAGRLFPSVEADSSFVAAILTVIGYSINDTVVVFDRIRENLRLRRRDPFFEVVNDSMWQTMARSIFTVLTVEFCVLSLFFLGGQTIHNFMLALLIGVTTGCYSSMFVACAVVCSWKAWEERHKRPGVVSRRAEVERRAPSLPLGTERVATSASVRTPAVAVAGTGNNSTSGLGQVGASEQGDSETEGAAATLQTAEARKARRKPSGAKKGKRKKRY